MRIQRFTPAATQIINLIQTDIGRPVNHIVANLAYGHLVQDIEAVLDTLVPREIEVQSKEGRWHLMRILPYRTVENVIEGAVVTFVEITEQKRTQEQLTRLSQEVQQARDYAESIIDTVHESPVVVLDDGMRVVSANQSFYQTFRAKPTEVEGQLLYDLGDKQWAIPELRRLLEEILPGKTTFRNFKLTHNFPSIGNRTMLLNAQEIHQRADKSRLILLAIEDITKAGVTQAVQASGE